MSKILIIHNPFKKKNFIYKKYKIMKKKESKKLLKQQRSKIIELTEKVVLHKEGQENAEIHIEKLREENKTLTNTINELVNAGFEIIDKKNEEIDFVKSAIEQIEEGAKKGYTPYNLPKIKAEDIELCFTQIPEKLFIRFDDGRIEDCPEEISDLLHKKECALKKVVEENKEKPFDEKAYFESESYRRTSQLFVDVETLKSMQNVLQGVVEKIKPECFAEKVVEEKRYKKIAICNVVLIVDSHDEKFKDLDNYNSINTTDLFVKECFHITGSNSLKKINELVKSLLIEYNNK